jgi:hypothetical protein
MKLTTETHDADEELDDANVFIPVTASAIIREAADDYVNDDNVA